MLILFFFLSKITLENLRGEKDNLIDALNKKGDWSSLLNYSLV